MVRSPAHKVHVQVYASNYTRIGIVGEYMLRKMEGKYDRNRA